MKNASSRFVDDLWATLRFQFKPLSHYQYPWYLLMAVLLPSTFITLSLPFWDTFKNITFAFFVAYVTVCLQVIICALVFAHGMFKGEKREKFSAFFSFFSLIWLIDSFALFFILWPVTAGLTIIIHVYVNILLIFALVQMSETSIWKVAAIYFLSLLLGGVISSCIQQSLILAGAVDRDKYNKEYQLLRDSLGIGEAKNDIIKSKKTIKDKM